MDNKSYYVYAHEKETDGSVFYIGKGKLDRAWNFRKRNEYWKRVANKYGVVVKILFDNLSEKDALGLEIESIKEHRENGCKLCNLTDGGEGSSGWIPTTETRARMSKNNVFRRPEFIEQFSKLRIGTKHSKESRAKISTSLKILGRKPSQETIEKMRKTNTGRVFSQETLKKLSIAHTGFRHTEESKLKMSITRTGRKISEECKKKISIANKKSIVCSNGLTFDGIKDAVEWLNSIGIKQNGQGNISSCCAGKLKTAYGFSWKFVDLQKPETQG